MQLRTSCRIADLCEDFERITVYGDTHHDISSMALVSFAEEGDFVFVDNPDWLGRALRTKASVIAVSPAIFEKVTREERENRTFLVYEEPFLIFNHIVQEYHHTWLGRPSRRCQDYGRFKDCTVSPEAWVSESSELGAGTVVFPSAYIGAGARVGESCRILSGARIMDGVCLGDRVVIQPNAVLGGAPFYVKKLISGQVVMYPTCGTVQIGDDSEIGSCTCVDRGVVEDTVIGCQTKIDNLVQIGHGSVIGDRVVIAGQCGIAGHVRIGDNVYIEGQVGVAQNVSVVSDSIIRGRSVVSRSIKTAGEYAGVRARPKTQEAERQAAITSLVSLDRRLLRDYSARAQETEPRLRKLVSDQFGTDPDAICFDTRFSDDLSADSLDVVEFQMLIEDEFKIAIPDDVAAGMATFGNLVQEVSKILSVKEKGRT